MAKEITITIKNEGNIFEQKDREKFVLAFERLESDDQSRLLQIMQKPSALAALKKNWIMLKAMF